MCLTKMVLPLDGADCLCNVRIYSIILFQCRPKKKKKKKNPAITVHAGVYFHFHHNRMQQHCESYSYKSYRKAILKYQFTLLWCRVCLSTRWINQCMSRCSPLKIVGPIVSDRFTKYIRGCKPKQQQS